MDKGKFSSSSPKQPGQPSQPGQPASDLPGRVSSLQSQLSNLQQSVRLTSERDATSDLQNSVNGMGQRIANLRQRGYVFESELENQASNFIQQWTAMYPAIQQQINMQSTTLMNALRPVEMQMPQLSSSAVSNPNGARSMLGSMEANVNNIKNQASAAERTISAMYDQFKNQVSQVTHHLDEIEWMLTQLAEATFRLLPTEGGLMAVKAVYCPTGKEQKGDPEGVLFLTDQRLLFEQKEEVATKKVLFITTEKQKVQKQLWESPVALAETIITSKQGMLKNEDHIDIRFASGAPAQNVHFHVWQDCASWQQLINRAKSKEFDSGRAVAIDQAAAAKVKSAPTQCPSCGGTIKQVILRGMDNITCEYCGLVIRLTDTPPAS